MSVIEQVDALQAWLAGVDQDLNAALEPLTAELIELSHDIHDHPEIRFEEVHAAGVLTASLAEHGFDVTRGFAGLETAFVGRWSTPDAGADATTVAIFCEYDALEGIGHACGHNVIATAGLGAGLLTKQWLQDHPETPARLVVIGSPGEEGAAGKVPMIDAGVLDGIDLAIMIHPSSTDLVRMSSLSRVALDIEFTGRATHAAASPYDGVNALDAATLTWTAIGMLRQQIPDASRIHGIITDGGQAPNIIPEHAALRVFVRSPDRAELLETLVPKVRNCALGAATATGCEVLIEERTPAYLSMISNAALAEVAEGAFKVTGREVQQSKDSAGSTDMGNVSQVVPAIHPMIKLAPEGTNPHTREFAEATASPEADQAVLDGAKILAMTALRAFTDPVLVARAKEEFASMVGG